MNSKQSIALNWVDEILNCPNLRFEDETPKQRLGSGKSGLVHKLHFGQYSWIETEDQNPYFVDIFKTFMNPRFDIHSKEVGVIEKPINTKPHTKDSKPKPPINWIDELINSPEITIEYGKHFVVFFQTSYGIYSQIIERPRHSISFNNQISKPHIIDLPL